MGGAGFFRFVCHLAVAHGAHQPSVVVLVRSVLRTSPPASELECSLHRRSTDHLFNFPYGYTGSWGRCLQHLRTVRHVDWIDNYISHCRLQDGCFAKYRQEISRCTHDWISRSFLGFVCLDDYCVSYWRLWSASCRQDWHEAGLDSPEPSFCSLSRHLLIGEKSIMARRLCNPVNVNISLCEHYLAPFLKDNNVSRRKRIDIVDFLLNCIFLVVVYTKTAHYISIQRAQNTNLTFDSSRTSFIRDGSQSITTVVEPSYDYAIYLGYLPHMEQCFSDVVFAFVFEFVFAFVFVCRVVSPCRVKLRYIFRASRTLCFFSFFPHNHHATLSSRAIMVLLPCHYPRMQIPNSTVGLSSIPYLSRLADLKRNL
jgi:hypothetical protein